MRTIETTVYQFSELSDAAKERARQWYRDSNDDNLWSEHVIEDAHIFAAVMGISIDHIYWSGFSSQGDGACFVGSYRYAKGAPSAIKSETNDEELIRIAQALQDIQRQHFYRLGATVTHRGHYYHERSVSIEVYNREEPCADIGDAEEEISELLRDYMCWIYKQLEDGYDRQNSDEQVDEVIIANEYEFTENGERS